MSIEDDDLYDWKAFYPVKIVFIHPLWMMANLSIIKQCPNLGFSGPYFPPFGLSTEIIE